MAERDFIGGMIRRQADQQKESVAWWSAFVWIVSGIYLFAATPEAHFFSFAALIFFTAGIFAASVIYGLIGYAVQRGIAWALTHMIGMPSAAIGAFISLLGVGLLIAQTVIVYLGARQFVYGMV